MGIFWFLHLSHVYLSIKFPIQLNFLKRKKWSRGLHITEVTGAVILSAIGPMVVFISGNEYNIATIPPIMCFPASTHLSIYTMSMPLVMMFTIGVCIIIIMLWTLIKVGTLVIAIIKLHVIKLLHCVIVCRKMLCSGDALSSPLLKSKY